MKTTAAQRAIHAAIAADIERLGRPEAVRESVQEAWARAAELRAAGMDFEADNVEQQAREMMGEGR